MKKTAGDKTKEKILKAAIEFWPKLTLTAIAEAADTTHSLILYHFPNGSLRHAVAEYAVETGCSRIIVQLIAEGHDTVSGLSAAERSRHFKSI